jgi:hypothetical protein
MGRLQRIHEPTGNGLRTGLQSVLDDLVNSLNREGRAEIGVQRAWELFILLVLGN